ncbi:MAG: hypothetical protein ACK5Q5_16335 [Planctomycetaceae bacterium]
MPQMYLELNPPVSTIAPEQLNGSLTPKPLELTLPGEPPEPFGAPSTPLMPPACGETPATPDLSALPLEPAAGPSSASAEMQELPPSAWEQIETRVQALEAQLDTSRSALQAMTAALQSAHTQIERLQAELDAQRLDFERLETTMDERHLADLERLTRLSKALDALIQRETDTSKSAPKVLK